MRKESGQACTDLSPQPKKAMKEKRNKRKGNERGKGGQQERERRWHGLQ